jgi:hypothetical protein
LGVFSQLYGRELTVTPEMIEYILTGNLCEPFAAFMFDVSVDGPAIVEVACAKPSSSP